MPVTAEQTLSVTYLSYYGIEASIIKRTEDLNNGVTSLLRLRVVGACVRQHFWPPAGYSYLWPFLFQSSLID